MKNKRGLSTVITSLIIILLVLVAVGIVWIVIRNVIETGSEEIELGQFTLDLDIKDVSVGTENISMNIKRNAGKGELTGIKFIFNDGFNSEILEETNINLEELGQRGFSFVLNQLNLSNVETISVAPMYKTKSGKIIIGRIISTYRLKGISSQSCTADCTGKECGSDGCAGTCPPGCGSGEYCSSGTCIIGTNPCDLTSATWSQTSVVEGTAVNLNIIGTDCDGQTISFEVWEDDLVGDDPVSINPVNVIFTGNSATGIWTAEWQDDVSSDPEYYFIATVVGESETITSSNQLTVTQPLGTCAQIGGTTCTGEQYCSGNTIPASDTTRCCDATCENPTCTTCDTCGDGLFNICDRPECYSCTGDSCYFIDRILVDECNSCGGATCESYDNDQTTCIDDPCNLGSCSWSGSQCLTQTESQVTRSFSSTTVSTGAQIDVMIDVTIISGETFYAIEEYIPSGWVVTSGSTGLPDASNTYRWVWIEGVTGPRQDPFTYTVQAPATTGNYVFDGIYMFEGETVDTTTKGQTTVTVV
ncbi:MAG: hypothetical protein ABIA78_01815 [archaeon]